MVAKSGGTKKVVTKTDAAPDVSFEKPETVSYSNVVPEEKPVSKLPSKPKVKLAGDVQDLLNVAIEKGYQVTLFFSGGQSYNGFPISIQGNILHFARGQARITVGEFYYFALDEIIGILCAKDLM